MSKTTSFYCFPEGYNTSSLSCLTQQYINYHCRKNLFYCCSLCLRNSSTCFLHTAIVHKPILFHFQTKDSNMYVYAHPLSPNDGDRNQQNNQLLSPFLYNTFLYWLISNPIHWYNMFLLASFFRQVKDINKPTHPEACFFITHFYID